VLATAAAGSWLEGKPKEAANWLRAGFAGNFKSKSAALALILVLAFNALILGVVAAKTVYRTARLADYALNGNFSYYAPNEVSSYVNATLPKNAKLYQFGYNFNQLLSSSRQTIKHTYFLNGAISGNNERDVISEIDGGDVEFVVMNDDAKCENGTESGWLEYRANLAYCREFVPELYGYLIQNYVEIKNFSSGWRLMRRRG
jgi:hypothetical protein